MVSPSAHRQPSSPRRVQPALIGRRTQSVALASPPPARVRPTAPSTTETSMLSRRTFIGVSSMALAGTACRANGVAATVANAHGGKSDASLPPSIAALTSMKDQATPISADERRVRIERARQRMHDRGIDVIMLTGGTSLAYFTGLQWGLSERLLALILPAKTAPFLVTPKFEESRAMEQVKTCPLDTGTEILTWEEHESPYELIA